MLCTLGTKLIVCHAHTSATQPAHTNNTTQSSQPTPHHHHCCGCHLHHNHNYNNYNSNPIMHPCYLLSKLSVCNCNSWLIAGAKCFAPSAPSLLPTKHTHQPHNAHNYITTQSSQPTHRHHCGCYLHHMAITTTNSNNYTINA